MKSGKIINEIGENRNFYMVSFNTASASGFQHNVYALVSLFSSPFPVGKIAKKLSEGVRFC